MKNFQANNKILIIIFSLLLFFINGCSVLYQETINIEDENKIEPVYSIKLKKNNTESIKDCTPEFLIYTDNENIVSMSISGDAENWSEWVEYSKNYDQFNIASGRNGTIIESGTKTVYIRFKDTNGIIFPQDFQDPVFCCFEYEMQELFSIRIEPYKVQVKPGGKQSFTVRGYDYYSKNEVPINGEKVQWSKSCAVGMFNSTLGLQIIYTAPEKPGIWNLSAHYGSLGTGAKVHVIDE